MERWEKAQDKKDSKELEGQNFWAWEMKLLRQEQQHFKDHLDNLQDTIDSEIDNFLGEQDATEVHSNDISAQVKNEIEIKYKK